MNEIEKLKKKIRDLEDKNEDLKVRLITCNLCGRPFKEGIPHINCADSVASESIIWDLKTKHF